MEPRIAIPIIQKSVTDSLDSGTGLPRFRLTMYGDEVEMGRFRNEGRLQRGNMIPYVQDNGEHIGD
jgi:hypothetical protein